MRKIEVDPMPMTGLELVNAIAEPFAETLAKRNNFVEDGVHYDVSKSLVLPSDFIPDEEARYALRAEHRAQTLHLENIGVEVGDLPQVSLTGNLETERNLPQYQGKMLGRLYQDAGNKGDAVEQAAQWIRTWTTEESFHEDVLRDGGLATGVIDLRELDIALINLQTTDLGLDIETLPELWSYLMPQEAATVISHENTATLFGPKMRQMMVDVAKNEATHRKVNTDLLALSFQLAPDHTIQVLYRMTRNFSMPGKQGIPNYDKFEEDMAVAGIFDFAAFRKLMRDRLQKLKVEDLDLSGNSANARDKLLAYVSDDTKTSKIVDSKIEQLREAKIADAAKRGVIPFILGRTVEVSRAQPLRRVA